MKINKLTALQVARAQPGRYGDGGGLAFLVSTAPTCAPLSRDARTRAMW
jgi:hypothetical protein